MSDSQEPPESPEPVPTMPAFFTKVDEYRKAFIAFWGSFWSWPAILVLIGLAGQFSYGAMTEGRYILALVLYLLAIGLVAARAAYQFREHPLRRQITQVIVVVALIIFAGLAYWTYSAHLKKEAQDRQLSELTDLVKGQDRFRPERILERYPLGYVVYEINYSNQVFPYGKRELEGYVINWKSAGIIGVSDQSVEIQVPDFVIPEGHLTFRSGVVRLPKQAGALQRIILIDGIGQSVELVAVRETGFVFLIGFEQVPIPEEIRRRYEEK